ncbi:MAG: protein sorting system archaetidylserine decarboxylase [Halodesulfurarchaeum sp.]
MQLGPGGRRLAAVPQLAPRAWRLAAVPLAVAGLLLALSSGWGIVALGVAAGVLWFHRDPDRTPPSEGVLAPADGTVTVIREEDDRLRVGVFMGVTDVHVNRAPMGGTVTALEHVPGAHRPAFSKESRRNERVRMAIGDIDVILIAGAFARRIHPYVEEGDSLDRGERIGHVSFGSRADVLLPPSVSRDDVRVETGETVRAGETVLAGTPTASAD